MLLRAQATGWGSEDGAAIGKESFPVIIRVRLGLRRRWRSANLSELVVPVALTAAVQVSTPPHTLKTTGGCESSLYQLVDGKVRREPVLPVALSLK